MGNYLFLLLILACPLMMIWMMRGGHSHGSHTDGGQAQGHEGRCDHGHSDSSASTDDLRRQREELDRLIEEREQSESELTPAGSAKR